MAFKSRRQQRKVMMEMRKRRPGSPPRKTQRPVGMARLESVTVEQAEGRVGQMLRGTFDRTTHKDPEEAANQMLSAIRRQAPPGGTYLKTDVTATFRMLDGSTETFKTRHDITEESTDGTVRGHILRFLNYEKERDPFATRTDKTKAARLLKLTGKPRAV